MILEQTSTSNVQSYSQNHLCRDLLSCSITLLQIIFLYSILIFACCKHATDISSPNQDRYIDSIINDPTSRKVKTSIYIIIFILIFSVIFPIRTHLPPNPFKQRQCQAANSKGIYSPLEFTVSMWKCFGLRQKRQIGRLTQHIATAIFALF